MQVLMDVFSGRPNPVWELTPHEADALVDRITAAPEVMAAPSPAALGLRGFIVETHLPDRLRRPGLPLRFALPAGTPAPAAPRRRRRETAALRSDRVTDPRADITDFLLETAQRAVDAQVLEKAKRSRAATAGGPTRDSERVERSMATTGEDEVPATAGGNCRPLLTPLNSAFWEYAPIRLNNNCYNYATNFASNTVAQPGRRVGHIYQAFDCDAVQAAARLDGCLTACEGNVRVVALAIWPGVDFHWYRLHPGGLWAHKLGITDVWTHDNLGRILANGLTPATCDRGPYTVFCGFFYAPLGLQVL
jgi:hypothetical protein